MLLMLMISNIEGWLVCGSVWIEWFMLGCSLLIRMLCNIVWVLVLVCMLLLVRWLCSCDIIDVVVVGFRLVISRVFLMFC